MRVEIILPVSLYHSQNIRALILEGIDAAVIFQNTITPYFCSFAQTDHLHHSWAVTPPSGWLFCSYVHTSILHPSTYIPREKRKCLESKDLWFHCFLVKETDMLLSIHTDSRSMHMSKLDLAWRLNEFFLFAL